MKMVMYLPNDNTIKSLEFKECEISLRSKLENKRTKTYRYDLIGADLDHGIREHPQAQMKKLGFNVIKSEPISIADCWMFEVDNDIDNIPGYLTEVNYKWY